MKKTDCSYCIENGGDYECDRVHCKITGEVIEEYASISTPDERAEVLNAITEAVEDKEFWVAGFDDTDGVFLKVLLMKG